MQTLSLLIRLPHSDSPVMPHKEDILVLKVNADKYVHLLIRFLFDSGVTPQLLSAECDHQNLLLTIIDRCVGSTCGNAEVDQEADQLLFALAIFLLLLDYYNVSDY